MKEDDIIRMAQEAKERKLREQQGNANNGTPQKQVTVKSQVIVT